MARIVLSEQQFKDYMRILRENEKKKQLVKKIIKESMEEGSFRDYVNDVSDNLRYGYSMGNGEPKDWKEAVARCGYDLISSNNMGFDCIPRYGFMGNADAIDEPEDVANMLTKFGIKAKYMGTFKTLNGQDVEKFKFIKGPVRESIEEAGGINVDEYTDAHDVLYNIDIFDDQNTKIEPLAYDGVVRVTVNESGWQFVFDARAWRKNERDLECVVDKGKEITYRTPSGEEGSWVSEGKDGITVSNYYSPYPYYN